MTDNAMTDNAMTLASAFDHNTTTYTATWRATYAALRQECPMRRAEAYGGFYVVARNEDVRRVLLDSETFSSDHGVEFDGIGIPPFPIRAIPVETDPPEHTGYRRLLSPWFTPAAAAGWELFARDVTTAALDAVIETGSMDLVLDLVSPVPAILIAKLFGLPTEDWRVYSQAAHPNHVAGSGGEKPQSSWPAVLQRVMEVVRARRLDPRDDLVTAIATAEIDGRRLPEEETLQVCFQVIAAGVDTTTSLASESLWWLSQHPEAREWLRADPGRIDGACEELLRYFSTTQAVARTVTRDVEVNGRSLHRGDRVLVSLASANLDDTGFDRANEVVLDRTPNRHVGFGLGPHRCVGMHLARVTFRVMVEELLERVPDFTVDPAKSQHYELIGMVNGWQSLSATFTPGARRGSSFRF